MTRFVARTFTEIAATGAFVKSDNTFRSLEEHRETAAYVVLGSPGSGKTTALRREADRQAGCYVTARDFTTFDDRPEWRGATLYIDGLDEIRAGATDGRTPFDAIRRKLEQLGRPRFRLSCREADWFGADDRDHLEAVSPDGTVTVLRLEPLSEGGIRDILRANFGMEDPDAFVAAARERGIDGLLDNPQSLRMLAVAVEQGGTWPATRLQTFDMACRTLLREHSHGHRAATPGHADIPSLMDAAGQLCAIQLLTGKAGYAHADDVDGRQVLELARIPGDDRALLRQALATKLFEAPPHAPATPVHRQVAEFLAGTYLRGLIAGGLPVGRILALLTGHDGVVVSELRGLAAWLAACSKPARTEVIARDPLGTVVYGDARIFSVREKTLVLEGLLRLRDRDREYLRTVQTSPRMGDLATPDMEAVFRASLTDPSRAAHRQVHVFCLLAALRHGHASAGLTDLMPAIVRDGQLHEGVRSAALQVFALRRAGTPAATTELEALLAEVSAGTVSDPDDDLLGTLLSELYPARLRAPEVLRYLREPRDSSYLGSYYTFWTRRVPERATDTELVALLDAAVEQVDRFLPAFVGSPRSLSPLRRLPLVWLKGFLERSGGKVPPSRLATWFELAARPELQAPGAETEFFREWLTANPGTMKDIIKQRVEHCVGAGDFHRCIDGLYQSLFRTPWALEFGPWLLDQALAAESSEAADWYLGWVAVAVHHGNRHEGLARRVVEERLASRPDLQATFAAELAKLAGFDGRQTRDTQERHTETRNRQREWRRRVKERERELRDNRCPPELLHRLAQAYFNEFLDVQGDTPVARLHDLLGGDRDLIDAVLEGFRQSIRRPDAPTHAEILRLGARDRTHWLALPIMAGLEEAAQDTAPESQVPGETAMRLALAIHYTVPRNVSRPPRWFPPLLDASPDVVADILVQSVRSKMAHGKDVRPDVYDLALSRDHAAVASLAALPLLTAFPARCTAPQLPSLGVLLQAGLLHSDRAELLELIEKKLAYGSMNVGQRVYWLAAGFLAAPGKHGDTFETFVGGSERRVRQLAEFIGDHDFSMELFAHLDSEGLGVLIRLIGSSFRPYARDSRGSGFVGRPRTASDQVSRLVELVATIPTGAATRVLRELAAADDLRPWRPHLVDASCRQNTVRREFGFRYCDLERVIDVLRNYKPANAADLATLVVEKLDQISKDIRHGNTSGWRKYWNVDGHDRPLGPKPEVACRDYLVDDLRHSLAALDVAVEPEGRYADDTRADIRVSHSDFNVPVEIKRCTHRDLWSAIRDQLIARYSRDPGADGHGIYLVFWFGGAAGSRPVAALGSRPASAHDLRNRLQGTLSDQEQFRISVRVIDVSDPRCEPRTGRPEPFAASVTDESR